MSLAGSRGLRRPVPSPHWTRDFRTLSSSPKRAHRGAKNVRTRTTLSDRLDSYDRAFPNRLQKKIIVDHALQLEVITTSLTTLSTQLTTLSDKLDKRMDKLDKRMDELDKKLDNKIDGLDKRMDELDKYKTVFYVAFCILLSLLLFSVDPNSVVGRIVCAVLTRFFPAQP